MCEIPMKHNSILYALISCLMTASCGGRVVLPDSGDADVTSKPSHPEPEGCEWNGIKCGTELFSLEVAPNWLASLGVARGLSGSLSIAADASDLWVCVFGLNARTGLFKLPKTGGSPRWIDGADCTVVVSDGTTVFWNGVLRDGVTSGVPVHRVFAVNGSSAPRAIVDVDADYPSLTIGGDRVFWIDRVDGPNPIRSAPKSGGTTKTIVDDSGASGLWSLAADAGHVFWIAMKSDDSGSFGVVMRATHDGGDVRELYRAPNEQYRAIALLGDAVLFVKEHGGIWKVPKLGGAASWTSAPDDFGHWNGRIPIHSASSSVYLVDNNLESYTSLIEIGATTQRDAGYELIPDFAVDEKMLYELKMMPGGPLRIVARPR
jgi:hypothetical protein